MVKPGPAARRLSRSQRNVHLQGAPVEGQSHCWGTPIALDKGDPSFRTPDYICEAATRAMRDGYTHYSPGDGYIELRAAIAARLAPQAVRPLAPEEVVITTGGSAAIYAALAAFLTPGDEILTANPTYSLYADVARALDVEMVYAPLAPGYRLDLGALAAAVTPNVRVLIVNSPNNPTGTVLTAAELDGLAELAERHDLLVVSDEVYDHILFDGHRHLSALSHPGLFERTLLVNSFSKTYAMTGWRIGYLAGSRELVSAAAAVHRTMTGCVNSIAQRAALAALTEPAEADWLAWMQEQYERRRTSLIEALARADLPADQPPEGSFYAFFRHGLSLPSERVTAALAGFGVLVRSGSEYGPGGEGYLRVTFTPNESGITEGVRRVGLGLREIARAGLPSGVATGT